ncbi:hypothetical protein CEP54_010578 [Fusarium duplospermum]|uniref:HypA-like protein n=1 Tax=Fusarium duplospermum TaxID=1325734 RepID=A0A428PJE9_9HYPO|nr:hypothetical protein CEP54_010578 [Fusarium duplospermum]
MATPFKIEILPKDAGLLGLKLGSEEALKVSELLQRDLEHHHVFFNASGFHDHIVHHVLTLYGTGASTKDMDIAYDANKGYQLKAMKPKQEMVDNLEHGSDWSTYLGKGRNYAAFLRFFQDEIQRIGWQEVLNEYLFKNDDRGRNLKSRLFGGLLHPLIQMLYAIEWEQPMLVASALAQTAVHENKLHDFLTTAAANAKADDAPPKMSTILGLLDDIHSNEKTKNSARWNDSQPMFQGVLGRARDEMGVLASRVRVGEEEVEERTAEMVHTAAYMAAGAAFHPPHTPKFDFFLMHHVTSTPFFLSLNAKPWISASTKAQLLEYKIRMDLLTYAARGCPTLHGDLLREYTPRDGKLVDKMEDLLPRIHKIVDDGHTVKLARALILAKRTTEPFEDKEWVKIKGDDWLRAMHLLLDANENAGGTMWVRGAGFDQAWDGIPKARM